MLLVTCKVLAVVLCSSWGLTEVIVVHLVVKLVVMVFMAVTVTVVMVIGGACGGGGGDIKWRL